MLLRVSSADIWDNRPGEADEAISLARMAAYGLQVMEPNSAGGLRAFGPRAVAVLDAENAIVNGRPDVVIKAPHELGGDRCPPAVGMERVPALIWLAPTLRCAGLPRHWPCYGRICAECLNGC